MLTAKDQTLAANNEPSFDKLKKAKAFWISKALRNCFDSALEKDHSQLLCQ